MPALWTITRDLISEPGEPSRVGYGQTYAQADETNASFDMIVGRTVFMLTNVPIDEVPKPWISFRLLDDDGIVYYQGFMSKDCLDSDEYCFAPLRWAEADAGCTELQCAAENEPWETL